jgi:hypothetical protein
MPGAVSDFVRASGLRGLDEVAERGHELARVVDGQLEHLVEVLFASLPGAWAAVARVLPLSWRAVNGWSKSISWSYSP